MGRFSHELIPCLEIISELKNYRDSEEFYRKANERVDELIRKEREDYNNAKWLCASNNVDNINRGLKYMLESGSPFVTEEDIRGAKSRVSQVRQTNIKNKIEIILGLVMLIFLIVGLILGGLYNFIIRLLP